jgi:lipopolysaccharide/colanic/teichoic acid biosynthesis glycosyltransferase
MLPQRTIVVDAGRTRALLVRTLLERSDDVLDLVAFVDAEPNERLEHADRLRALVGLFQVERAIVACSPSSVEATVATVRALKDLDLRLELVAWPDDGTRSASATSTIEGFPIARTRPGASARRSRRLQRVLDVIGASLALIVTWPAFVYAAWAVKRDSSGPVLVRRRYLGLGMKEFDAFEFRTTPHSVAEASRHESISRVMSASGRLAGMSSDELDGGQPPMPTSWLRSTRVGEVPQLINVLRGEMSLVGPPPCVQEETDAFKQRHFERFLVRPGIIGRAHIADDDPASFVRARDSYAAYARDRSLRRDVHLLIRALAKAGPKASLLGASRYA